MVKRSRFAIVLAAGLLALLQGCKEQAVQEAEFFVFGTLLTVQIRGGGDEETGLAVQELQQRFQGMHQDWHAWEPGRLTAINQAFAGGQSAPATPELVSLVRYSQQFEQSSQGNFNAAAGGLVRLWGFHTSDFPVRGPMPSGAAIQSWLDQRPSSLDITISDDRLSSSNPAVQLDFGGIAKGMAVDIAMGVLAGYGLHTAMVNAGGDLRARSIASDPWKVGIEYPPGGVLAALEITTDEAVFTSGTSQRFLEDGSARYPHVLNPANGWPVRGLQAVTVIAADGVSADAAATALLVAGPERWLEIAGNMGIRQALVIDDAGRVFATPEMDARLAWAGDFSNSRTVVGN